MTAPLRDPDAWLPPHVRAVVDRPTPIVTFAGRAGAAATADPGFVRSDIGQIIGVEPAAEVLYGPPVGLAEVREAVAELYRRSLGGAAELDGANVCMTTGACEGLSLLLRCFAHGRRVALPRGHWENYDNAVDLAGGEVVVVDVFDEAGALDVGGLERQLDEAGTEVVLINFPCNPTGAVLSHAEARELGAMLRRLDVLAIADEVYANLRYDGVAPRSLIAEAPEHVVSVGSGSKQFLLPGARVGWVVSAAPRVTDVILRKVLRGSTASPNVLGQRLLLEVLGPDLEAMAQDREPPTLTLVTRAMVERRDALLEVLGRYQMAAVATRPPEGTIFLMAAVPPWFDGDDAAFAEKALSESLFSCVPGSAFGLPGQVRLSYGALSREAIEALDGKLAALKGR